MRTAIATARIKHAHRVWTAEMRESPLRIDVWCGVEWMGQWAWFEGKFGHRISGRGRLSKDVQEAIREEVCKLDMGAFGPITERKLSEEAEMVLLALFVLTGGQANVSANETNMRLMCDRFTKEELIEMARRIKEGQS